MNLLSPLLVSVKNIYPEDGVSMFHNPENWKLLLRIRFLEEEKTALKFINVF
jgi:hypothetical protein